MTIDEILARLRDVKPDGANKWKSRCPCSQKHKNNDETPSLSIAYDSRSGNILMYCHTGCTIEEICEEIGCKTMDLMREPNKDEKRKSFLEWYAGQNGLTYEHTYSYDYGKYKDGLAKVRFRKSNGEKDFRWIKEDNTTKSGYKMTHEGCPNRLYIAGDEKSDIILLVEGEKDANTAHKITGYAAASVENGAARSAGSKWREEYTAQLEGKTVYIFGDNDEVGKEFVEVEAQALEGHAAHIYVIDITKEWEDCPEKGDVSDMAAKLGKDKTKNILRNLINNAVERPKTPVPPADGKNINDVSETPENATQEATEGQQKDLLTVERAKHILNSFDDHYLQMPHFPQLSKILRIRTHDSIAIAADTGTGKSSLALNILHELQSELPAVYINLEMDEATILQRLVAIHTGMDLDMIEGYKNDDATREKVDTAVVEILSRKEIRLLTDVYNLEKIEEHIKAATQGKTDPTIVFIDTGLLITTDNRSASRYERFTHISEELRRIARLNNVILFVLLQQNRAGKQATNANPKNSSLKETGSWENDATKVMFLSDETKESKKLTITKNRNGELGEIVLNYTPCTQTYSESKNQKPKIRESTDEHVDMDEDIPFL